MRNIRGGWKSYHVLPTDNYFVNRSEVVVVSECKYLMSGTLKIQ